MYKLAVLGNCCDGPDNIIWQPTSESQLLNLMGGSFVERHSVSPTASSCALMYEPWLTPSNSVNGQIGYLFQPTVSGSVMVFGEVGLCALPATNTIDFTYTPYLGESDLIWAARKHNAVNQYLPYIGRVPGSFATFTVSGWNFESRYSGLRYNNVWVVCDGASSVTVGGLEPNYPTQTYTGTYQEIQSAMYADYLWGVVPCTASWTSTNVPLGSGYLSGGLDGVVTSDNVATLLNSSDLPSDCTHVLILQQLDQELVNVIFEYLANPLIQPRIFMCAAPAYTSPTSSWITTQITNIPKRHDFIVSVVGDIECQLDGQIVNRYAAEGTAIAFSKVDGSNITNIPVNATSFEPELTSSELIAMKNAGFMTITRHISTDISTYQGCTNATANTFLWNSKIAEIFSASSTYCNQFFGQYLNDGPQPTIASGLSQILDTITFLELESVDVTSIFDTLSVFITGTIDTEILSIKFVIQNH